MKQFLAILFTALVFLSASAQDANVLVVSNAGQGVSFNINQIDSISFNPSDTVGTIRADMLLAPGNQLSQLLQQLDQIRSELSRLQSDQGYLIMEKDWLFERYNDLSKALLAASQRIDTLTLLTDSNQVHLEQLVAKEVLSLQKEFSHGLDSVRTTTSDSLAALRSQTSRSLNLLAAQTDSLHRQLADTLQHQLSNRIQLIRDSLLCHIDTSLVQLNSSLSLLSVQTGRQFSRLDSVTARTDTLLLRMQQEWSDAMSGQMLQYNTAQTLMQQRIDQLTQTVDSLSAQLEDTNRRLAKANVFVDAVTGVPYHLTVQNGTLTAATAYDNILILGNSFTTSDPTPDLWWSDHSMAASTPDVTYVKYLEEQTGGQIDILRGWNFEWNYQNPDYDFATIFPIWKDYDVVIVQIQENAWPNPDYDYQAAWERLYAYLKSRCPYARFMQCIGWYEEQRYEGIVRAAANYGIPVIDNRAAVSTGCFSTGDYVLGSDDQQYHAINNASVAQHPSDVGFLLMANNILTQLHMPLVTSRMHQLQLSSAEGGSLSVPYHAWPEKGVVSVRIQPDKGRRLASLSVQTVHGNFVSVTLRRNSFFDGEEHDYCTFIMPADDVTITAAWQ